MSCKTFDKARFFTSGKYLGLLIAFLPTGTAVPEVWCNINPQPYIFYLPEDADLLRICEKQPEFYVPTNAAAVKAVYGL